MHSPIQRRHFLAGTALAAAALPVATVARATANSSDSDYTFEVQRSEDEWRAMLAKDEYNILRKGSTELPKSHPLWNEERAGGYACKGCDLPVYTSVWKVPLDKGWAFYKQSIPNSILMGIDGQPPDGMSDDGPGAMIEAHCRRCGSHLGHILKVGDKALHCINGTSLVFTPESV